MIVCNPQCGSEMHGWAGGLKFVCYISLPIEIQPFMCLSKKLSNNQIDVVKFIHITDTHLLDRPEEKLHGLNTRDNLELVLSASQSRYQDIDFFIFTGDISQTGTEESYKLFKSVIEEYDIPVYCVPGNHDTPVLLQRIIPNCPDESIKIIQLDKFSLILLNSWVKDKHHGIITQSCLQQLDDYLHNSGDQFNIIAIHHPPIIIHSKWLDELGLQNQAEFLQVINRYAQNTLLVCGHVHQEVDQQLGNLRLLATPSTCHQFKANCKHLYHLEAPSPAYRFIKLNRADGIDTKVHYLE